ncbi:peptidase M75 family protein [Phycicoccus endophyticus]|uniref:Peptidase M75 family protein n=1 Tax=Phycicoccus endophyticus TaxID=1690220 RepID=A0A7G9R192_9MICO|nr:iron uptake system protein EfeO [Phycicoccus endophyticus]QNN49367.1 peptidase M75 family protein [Phycicoccus endophyticus]GGL35963.1 lipoprotein [Phycicoccus endophyticus]
MNRSFALAIAPAALLTLALSACADNTSGSSASGEDGPLTVTATDSGCEVSAASAPSGAVTFSIENTGTVANEFEVLAEDKLQIISEKENIGPGTTTDLTTSLPEGTYYTACKPNMVGDFVGLAEFTVTPGEEVEVSDDVKALQDDAVTKYTGYIKDQVGALVTATEEFADAYTSGDTATARRLFPLARMHYERIEPTAEAFGLEEAGDLDTALDIRVQDVAADAGSSVSDPDVLADWHGWHRIEADLFTPEDSPFTFADDAERQAEADALVENTQVLYDFVFGERTNADGKPFAVTLEDIANGAGGLMEEVALSKIVGEEETFSHTDLYDFQANVEGAQVAYANVAPIVEQKDPDLDASITEQFADIEDLLKAQQDGSGSGDEPSYPSYADVAAVQKNAGETPDDSSYTDVQRQFSDAVNGLSEALSKVAAVVLE